MEDPTLKLVSAIATAADCLQRALDKLAGPHMGRFETDYVSRQVVQARAMVIEAGDLFSQIIEEFRLRSL